jgi:hypothetical protein
MSEGELKKQINTLHISSEDQADVFDILDEAKKEMPMLDVVGGIPLWEKFFEAEGKWRTKWFGDSR